MSANESFADPSAHDPCGHTEALRRASDGVVAVVRVMFRQRDVARAVVRHARDLRATASPTYRPGIPLFRGARCYTFGIETFGDLFVPTRRSSPHVGSRSIARSEVLFRSRHSAFVISSSGHLARTLRWARTRVTRRGTSTGESEMASKTNRSIAFLSRGSRRRRSPHGEKITSECANSRTVVTREFDAPMLSCSLEVLLHLFELSQPLFPFTLQRSLDHAIVRVDGLVPPLCVSGRVACLLETRAPLPFEPIRLSINLALDRQAELELTRFHGVEQQRFDRSIDRHAGHAPADHLPLVAIPCTDVAESSRTSCVVARPHPAAAAATQEETTEQSGAFARGSLGGTSTTVIVTQLLLIAHVRLPRDVARMRVLDTRSSLLRIATGHAYATNLAVDEDGLVRPSAYTYAPA